MSPKVAFALSVVILGIILCFIQLLTFSLKISINSHQKTVDLHFFSTSFQKMENNVSSTIYYFNFEDCIEEDCDIYHPLVNYLIFFNYALKITLAIYFLTLFFVIIDSAFKSTSIIRRKPFFKCLLFIVFFGQLFCSLLNFLLLSNLKETWNECRNDLYVIYSSNKTSFTSDNNKLVILLFKSICSFVLIHTLIPNIIYSFLKLDRTNYLEMILNESTSINAV